MKDDRVYLRHILRCIARIEEYTIEGRDTFFAVALGSGWSHPQPADLGRVKSSARRCR